MPSAPIRFGNVQGSSFEELGGASPVAMNVLTDGTGTVRRRPGITNTIAVDPNGLDGVFVTQDGTRYAVGSGGGAPFRAIYRMTGAGPIQISGLGGSNALSGSGRPVFAETEQMLTIAGGAWIHRVDFGTDLCVPLSTQAPMATHVAANSLRLLANNLDSTSRNMVNYSDAPNDAMPMGSQYVRWTPGDKYFDPTGTEQFSTAGEFGAEAKPDWVVAVYEDSAEIFVFGREILEIWAADPTNVYSRVTAREYGCSAPYSVIRTDAAFAWIDHARRIVTGDGRSIQVISDPIKGALDSMASVADAYGFRMITGPYDAMVWTFPSDGRTLCYQPQAGWSQWSGWDGQNWTLMPITSRAFDSTNAVDVVALRTGKVGELDLLASDDDGQMIRAFVRTGFDDKKTSRRKKCNNVRLTLRRGQSQREGTLASLCYRDDLGDWSDPIYIDLGLSGDSFPVVQFNGLGHYRTRQWQFEFTGREPLSLVSAVEDYTELEM